MIGTGVVSAVFGAAFYYTQYVRPVHQAKFYESEVQSIIRARNQRGWDKE